MEMYLCVTMHDIPSLPRRTHPFKLIACNAEPPALNDIKQSSKTRTQPPK